MIHLAQKDLFQCSKCDYTNSNSIWELRKHCAAQHGPDAEAISNEEKHREAILIWNQKCFPDWKQKKPSNWYKTETQTRNEPEPSIDTSTTLNNNCDNNIDMNSCVEEFIKQIQDFKDKNGTQDIEENDVLNILAQNLNGVDGNEDTNSMDYDDEQPYNDSTLNSTLKTEFPQPSCSNSASPNPQASNPVNDRICQMCWEESRYPGRHISQKHLKKPLYECSICLKFGSYECCTVIKHMQKVHPKEAENATPINNLSKYADEILELQMKCFPNRQMKLVRPLTRSRPRERHHCNLCEKQIAQSDRQRHVYHRHLNKSRLFECPLCDFSSNYDVHRVKWHLKWHHRETEPQDLEPISHENQYREEIDELNEKCFPGWQHRRKPFWWLTNNLDQSQNEPNHQRDEENEEGGSSSEEEPCNETVPEAENKTETATNIQWTCQVAYIDKIIIY